MYHITPSRIALVWDCQFDTDIIRVYFFIDTCIHVMIVYTDPLSEDGLAIVKRGLSDTAANHLIEKTII